MEKQMKSPKVKDQGRTKSYSTYANSNTAQPNNQQSKNEANSINQSGIKSRKQSLNLAITERYQEDQAFSTIKNLIKGIKQKHGGKKYENDSDRYSDSKVDSEDSEEDFAEDARKGINENILNCITNFKKQFVKSEDPIQIEHKELVITLNQPVEQQTAKKKKKKNGAQKREDFKVCKQYKSKFQEDLVLQQLFDDVIGNKIQSSNKKNPMRNINKFIKDHYKEEEQQPKEQQIKEQQVKETQLHMPKIETFSSGSKLLPSLQKYDYIVPNRQQEQNRQEIKSSLSSSINMINSQNFAGSTHFGSSQVFACSPNVLATQNIGLDKKNIMLGKFYYDSEIKKIKNEKQEKSVNVRQRERSLTPLNITKGPSAQLISLTCNSGVCQNIQNKPSIEMDTVCDKNETKKQIKEKMKNQNINSAIKNNKTVLKSMDADAFRQSMDMNSSAQNSGVFEKENSITGDGIKNEDIQIDYPKGIQGKNSNKNPFYNTKPVTKLRSDLDQSGTSKTIQILNSCTSNDVKIMSNITNTIATKSETTFQNQTLNTQIISTQKDINLDDPQSKDTSFIPSINYYSNQSKLNPPNQNASNTVQMPRLNIYQKSTHKSKEQVNRIRSQSQHKHQEINQENQTSTDILKNVGLQLDSELQQLKGVQKNLGLLQGNTGKKPTILKKLGKLSQDQTNEEAYINSGQHNQELYNQITSKDIKIEKKNLGNLKTPVLSSLKPSNIKKRDSSLDLQVRPFSIAQNPTQKLDVLNENDENINTTPLIQYQAFQVRKNNSKLSMQSKIKSTNNGVNQSFAL